MACTKKYFIRNKEIIDTKHFRISELENTTALYEVVKINGGKALFFEDHINRLRHSAKLSGKNIPWRDEEISEQVERLVKLNEVKNGRLKFLFRYKNNRTPHFYTFFLKDITPPDEYYTQGIKTVFFKAGREQPGIKQIDYNLRRSVKSYIKERHAFEALFVNDKNLLTEGSKSNFFGIKQNTVYTTPEEKVLPGITRAFVLKICREKNIPFTEKNIPYDSVHEFDSAFISGTSIGILPVKTIEAADYSTKHPILQSIMKEYANITNKYLKTKQNMLT